MALTALLASSVVTSFAASSVKSYTRHAGRIPTERGGYYISLAGSVSACEGRCTANATGCLGFTAPGSGGDRCWLYNQQSAKSLARVAGDDWWQKPGTPPVPVRPAPPAPAPAPPPPAPPPTCTGPTCFSFVPDWKSGGATTTLPTGNFSVRKLEAVYYPPDGWTYVIDTRNCVPKTRNCVSKMMIFAGLRRHRQLHRLLL